MMLDSISIKLVEELFKLLRDAKGIHRYSCGTCYSRREIKGVAPTSLPHVGKAKKKKVKSLKLG